MGEKAVFDVNLYQKITLYVERDVLRGMDDMHIIQRSEASRSNVFDVI